MLPIWDKQIYPCPRCKIDGRCGIARFAWDTIVHISAPRAEAEVQPAAPAEGEEVKEPELVEKKKKEGEEEEKEEKPKEKEKESKK